MTVAVDTSVAVPLLVRSHHDHAAVVRWWGGQEITLSGHALVETYSVLTRLPGDARLAPADAARLLTARFPSPLVLSSSRARKLPTTLSRLGIAGIPAEAEELMVMRDIALCRLTGAPVHFLHLSTAGSVAMVRAAKAQGLPITAEAAPHHSR